MKYAVRCWSDITGVSFREFSNLDDAQVFADKSAIDFDSLGCEYDVAIYERTDL